MIITRTPLRITLGGGGTDLPSFYRRNEFGLLVAAAIDRYTYISVNENFDDSILLKYSEIERVERLSDVSHPLLRESLRHCGLDSRIEVSSMADVPSGTGLGSSGSFLVGLLNALSLHRRHKWTPFELASTACKIELEILGEPVGKQDQFVAAYGGIQLYRFNSDESVVVSPLNLRPEVLHDLEENLLLFYTNVRRSASAVLRTEKERSVRSTKMTDDNLRKTRDFALRTVDALERGDMQSFGGLLTEQWLQKFGRQPSALHDQINELIDSACDNGAIGGKLIGAGGGGFLLFYTKRQEDLRRHMAVHGLSEVRFGFDFQGSAVLVSP